MSRRGLISLGERRLTFMITSGAWEIDADGVIWKVRHRTRYGLHPTARRRIDRLLCSGYRVVKAVIAGEVVACGSHRLVWQMANGDIPDGLVVNHINGIKSDNRLENLEIVTQTQNQLHAHRTGLAHGRVGTDNPATKLTSVQVESIRSRYLQRERHAAIAADFGIHPMTVFKIGRGLARRVA